MDLRIGAGGGAGMSGLYVMVTRDVTAHGPKNGGGESKDLAYKRDRATRTSTSYNVPGGGHGCISCFIEALKKYNWYGKSGMLSRYYRVRPAGIILALQAV